MAKDQIVVGSIAAVARKNNTSIAESFMSAEIVIAVDTSGSMAESQGETTKYDLAVSELKKLQSDNSGKIAIFTFASDVQFCSGGIPAFLGSGTNVTGLLRHLKQFDGLGMRIIIISDGYPDNTESAFEIAKTFDTRIDTIFIGDPDFDASGKYFLQSLSGMSSVKGVAYDGKAQDLAPIITLLLGSGE